MSCDTHICTHKTKKREGGADVPRGSRSDQNKQVLHRIHTKIDDIHIEPAQRPLRNPSSPPLRSLHLHPRSSSTSLRRRDIIHSRRKLIKRDTTSHTSIISRTMSVPIHTSYELVDRSCRRNRRRESCGWSESGPVFDTGEEETTASEEGERRRVLSGGSVCEGEGWGGRGGG